MITGRVLDASGAPLAGARLPAASLSENEGEVYVISADAQANYRLALPLAHRHLLVADAPPRARSSQMVESQSQVVNFQLQPVPAPRPPDAEIAKWLRNDAISLSDSAELDEARAQAFSQLVGEAPFVAMGKATHGSAEFPQWRQRVFQALVRDREFTVYAVEVPWPEALALDDYVVHGTGDPREAFKALNTWKNETEETLRLVQWMRAYNSGKQPERKLHFVGFDVYTQHAVEALLKYLEVVEPELVLKAKQAFEVFLLPDVDSQISKLGLKKQQKYAVNYRASRLAWTRERHSMLRGRA